MTEKPHVLLVTVDHWPGSFLGVAGHPILQTPTLDQLARNGLRFTRAYTECPVCIPARRTLLTGTTPRTHGDRTFQPELRMPELPTVASAFRQGGYQTGAVGKLHIYPPRARGGFEEVQLCEEGRPQLGPTDDYEIYLGDQGLTGQQFLHGMSNNDYVARPWHLDEQHHVTNWTTRQMARMIQRRDPTRPGFWYLSYTHPHPPLVPPKVYWELYQGVDPGNPVQGHWKTDPHTMPGRMNHRLIDSQRYSSAMIQDAKRAFFGLCTHIDHQLRIVLGTLREEQLLDNTAIVFLADHGDMLGDHGLWAKRLFYEGSACIPMLLAAPRNETRVSIGETDQRLVGLQDVMPTLLDLAGLPIPDTVDGLSMIGETCRETLYGEYGVEHEATRMLHDGRFKLIYYASGNRRQLFDLESDPLEMVDLAQTAEYQDVLRRLTNGMAEEFYDSDVDWIRHGEIVGLPELAEDVMPDRTWSLQRGSHWPIPPQD